MPAPSNQWYTPVRGYNKPATPRYNSIHIKAVCKRLVGELNFRVLRWLHKRLYQSSWKEAQDRSRPPNSSSPPDNPPR
eukprot:1180825-Prorocentrum_minimum.AAC.2